MDNRNRIGASGGRPRFVGRANAGDSGIPYRDNGGDGPRFIGSLELMRGGYEPFTGRTREPITADDVLMARAGYTDTPIYPPQAFRGAPPPTPWTFEPIIRVIRMVHRHLNTWQGTVGSSRYPHIPRVVYGSHERVRGTVTPQRIRAGRVRNRLTVQPSNASYSETTEVLGG